MDCHQPVECREVGRDLVKWSPAKRKKRGAIHSPVMISWACYCRRYVGPGGGGDHADVGDIGISGGSDIGEVAMTVIEVDEAGGGWRHIRAGRFCRR